jgi:polyferredoxin
MKEKLKHLPLVLPLVSFGYAIVVILDNKENLYRFCNFPFPFIMCPVCEYPCFFNRYQLPIFSGSIIAGLIAGRLFCGGVCPAGSIQDWLASLKRRLFSLANRGTKKFAPKSSWKAALDKAWKASDKHLRFLKYPLLLLVILYSLNRFAMYWGFMPAWGIIPGARLVLEVRELAGHGFINFWLLILITVFIIGLLIHRPWCKYLCPIGLLFAVSNRISLLKIKLEKKRCTGCKKCLENCTLGQPLSKLERGFASVECVRCYDCVLNCPEGDVKLKAGIRH